MTNEIAMIVVSGFLSTNTLTGVTNAPITYTNNTAEIVKAAGRSGDICKVYGHRWEPGCGVDGCSVIHTRVMRYCVVCGKVESMEWMEANR